jgi:hypothetical protein
MGCEDGQMVQYGSWWQQLVVAAAVAVATDAAGIYHVFPMNPQLFDLLPVLLMRPMIASLFVATICENAACHSCL